MRSFALFASFLVALTSAAWSLPIPHGVAPQDIGQAALQVADPDSAALEAAKPSDLLRAAQSALEAGRSAAAREALEMAQTRLLDRSVPLGQTNNPSDNPTVGQISQALQALGTHDRAACSRLIQDAIGSASAQGL